MHVAGPPGGFVIPGRYDRYLFAGDHTALPQIARYLETLPPGTRGWAFLDGRTVRVRHADATCGRRQAVPQTSWATCTTNRSLSTSW